MKIFILYDKQGNIRGTLASALDNIGVKTGPRTRVHTIDKQDLKADDRQRYLRELHDKFRVDSATGEPTLAPKRQKSRRPPKRRPKATGRTNRLKRA